jgi:hypothetical protein
MSRVDNDGTFSPKNTSEQRMTLIAQLGQSIATMQHIDELFQWLAYAIVQHFTIQLVQFWVNQMTQTDKLAVQLRTVVRHDPTIPEKLIVNDYMASIAQRVMSERRSYYAQPIATLFPPYQAQLLSRYGLNYCGACFTSKNMLLPPPQSVPSSERVPVPFALTSLLISRQSPHMDVISTISMILEQAVIMAGRHNLLLSNVSHTPAPFAPQTPLPFIRQLTPPPATQPAYQETVFTLEQLIPRRTQDANQHLTENTSSHAAIISDKKARRLLAAINNRTNVASLSAVTGMSIKEVYMALQILLSQRHIEFYGPDGNPSNLDLL